MAKRTGRGVPAGVYRRGIVYYLEKRHPKLPGGRVRKSLETSELSVATERANALQVLMSRGDWGVVTRWCEGKVDITDLVAAVREGDYRRLRRISPSAPMLGEEIAEYLQFIENRKSKRTYDQYRSNLTVLASYFGEATPMDEIQEREAEAFLHGPKETNGGKPWGPTTRSHYQVLAGALWQRVIDREAREASRQKAVPTLTINPWREIERVERSKPRDSFLHPEEWRELLKAIQGTPYAAWMGVAFLGGLRKMEAAILRVDLDVDFERGLIHVQGTKSKTAKRTIPLNPELAKLLREHIRLGFAGRKFFFRSFDRDRPICQTTAEKWTATAYDMAGLPYGRNSEDGLTHHAGRHSFATWLAQQNVSPLIIAELLGDKVETVVKTYCHLRPTDLVDAVNLLN